LSSGILYRLSKIETVRLHRCSISGILWQRKTNLVTQENFASNHLWQQSYPHEYSTFASDPAAAFLQLFVSLLFIYLSLACCAWHKRGLARLILYLLIRATLALNKSCAGSTQLAACYRL